MRQSSGRWMQHWRFFVRLRKGWFAGGNEQYERHADDQSRSALYAVSTHCHRLLSHALLLARRNRGYFERTRRQLLAAQRMFRSRGRPFFAFVSGAGRPSTIASNPRPGRRSLAKISPINFSANHPGQRKSSTWHQRQAVSRSSDSQRSSTAFIRKEETPPLPTA